MKAIIDLMMIAVEPRKPARKHTNKQQIREQQKSPTIGDLSVQYKL